MPPRSADLLRVYLLAGSVVKTAEKVPFSAGRFSPSHVGLRVLDEDYKPDVAAREWAKGVLAAGPHRPLGSVGRWLSAAGLGGLPGGILAALLAGSSRRVTPLGVGAWGLGGAAAGTLAMRPLVGAVANASHAGEEETRQRYAQLARQLLKEKTYAHRWADRQARELHDDRLTSALRSDIDDLRWQLEQERMSR